MDLKPQSTRGFVLAVSAPSGTGKTSLCDKLAVDFPFIVRSISITTRPKRDGEISGKDYIFVDRDEFEKRKARGELLETAEVFGNQYGTPKGPVIDAVERGRVIVMDIDTVGALRIHELMPEDTVLVFVVPPSFQELENRLRVRGKNAADDLKVRLQEAKREVRESQKYHYILCNESFNEAYAELVSIVQAERMRRHRLEVPYLKG